MADFTLNLSQRQRFFKRSYLLIVLSGVCIFINKYQ